MEKQEHAKTSLFRMRGEALKPFTAVWISHLLVEVFLLMHPALVPVFRSEFNLSIFQAGLLITIPNLCRLIIVIPTGIFADRFGSRPFIILSMLVAGVSALLISQFASTSVLLFSLSLIMISVTLYHPPGMSVIGKLFPNQAERSTAIGLHGASGCIGQSLGTITLGLLLAQFGWRYCYLLLSVPLLAWTVVLAGVKIPQLTKETKTASKEKPAKLDEDAATLTSRQSFLTHGFLMLLLLMGLNALANGGVSAFMTTYLTSAEGLTVETASIIFGAGPLIGIVGSLAAGYVSARFGDKNALTITCFGQVIFLLGLITIPFLPLAALSFLLYQLFVSALWTPSTSMVATLVGKTRGGTAYSLFYFSHDGLGAVSPLLAAVLIESLGIVSPFVLAIILLIVGVVLARLMSPLKKCTG